MKYALALFFFAPVLFAQTYTIRASPTAENLRGLSAASSKTIWASGTDGTYLRSTDGGQSWQTAHVQGAEALDFRDVQAFNADLAYLLSAGPGDQSRIYKTEDAGKSWVLQFTNRNPKGFFDCMAFWNAHHGIAVGDPVDGKFELIATEDGQNWQALATDFLPPALDGEGAFAASGSCIAVQGNAEVWFATGGPAARVFHSRDSGKTWTVVNTPLVHGKDSAGIFSIAFRDPKHGVIAGGDYKEPDKYGMNLAFTDDGGMTWQAAAISPQWYFSAVAFSCVGTVVPGCPEKKSGAILALGTFHAAYADRVNGKWWRKTWDLNLNAVSFYAPGKAIAVGPKGLIVSFTEK